MDTMVTVDAQSETTPSLRVGGPIEGFPLGQWPHYNDMPLAYLAMYTTADETYFIFLDGPKNEVDQSWQAEDGSNAVLTVSDGIVSDLGWITPHAIDKPLERLSAVYNVDINGEPQWLQGDEYQAGYPFVGQIDSDLDPKLNIGDAHGVAYLFVDNDSKDGRLIWQA